AGVQRNVNIGLLDTDGKGGVGPGDWVLIHVGFALSQVDEAEASATLKLPAARLECRDAAGIAPRSRQPSDTPEAVDPDAVAAARDALLDLVDALDEALVARRQPAGARERASSTK
ncbi:MAG TPA: HypC/HybG/HupF family hydrogenase formation chaperone, partial [Solirubrobacteraceae bacterium]